MTAARINLDDAFRDLLAVALHARIRERAAHEPELLLLRSTHDGSAARDEADHLIRIMQVAQLRGGR